MNKEKWELRKTIITIAYLILIIIIIVQWITKFRGYISIMLPISMIIIIVLFWIGQVYQPAYEHLAYSLTFFGISGTLFAFCQEWGLISLNSLFNKLYISRLITLLISTIILIIFVNFAISQLFKFADKLKIKELIDLLKKITLPLIIALIISITIISIGIKFLNIYFDYSDPHFIWYPNDNLSFENVKEISEVTCKKPLNQEVYFYNDKLDCTFQITYFNETPTWHLNSFIIKEVNNKTPESAFTTSIYNQKSFNESFIIQLPNSSNADYNMFLRFIENKPNSSSTDISIFYKNDVHFDRILSKEDYDSWKIEKLTWFIAIIVGTLTTVFTVVQAFRDLTKEK
jgi:hypothetical protein